jgi:AP-4 complex subunit beta-1
VIHLLNRIKEFNEWQQATILEVVARFTPESKEELFDIMVRRTSLCSFFSLLPPISHPNTPFLYLSVAKLQFCELQNILEDLFRNSNSALVLSVTKTFLNLSQSIPAVHSQVLTRLKST